MKKNIIQLNHKVQVFLININLIDQIIALWHSLSESTRACIPIIALNVYVFLKNRFFSPILHYTYLPTQSPAFAMLVFFI